MKHYSTFVFDSYDIDTSVGRIELRYSLDDEVHFTEVLSLPAEQIQDGYDNDAFDRALFALHIIGGISYYKTCLPKSIEIRSGRLTEDQAVMWNTVYEKGLGEFFYRNEIDFRGLVNFPFSLPLAPSRREGELPPPSGEGWGGGGGMKHILIPIGGGKDSMVTIEALKKTDASLMLFRLGSHPFIDNLAELAGVPLLNVERQLSPTLFELNKQGALNGHVPITAYVSFVSVIVGILCGYNEIAFSNEHSANEGNVEYLGMQINHQWSKSAEAEEIIGCYIQQHIDADIAYYSALRQYSELEIVEQFVQYPQYFEATTSCNANWRILKDKPAERWINDPKSAFVYALYAAYLPKHQLLQIFGKDFFNEEELLPVYRQLLGLEGFKPFECVGTPEETREAFALAHNRGDLDESVAMNMFISETT